MAKIDIHDNLFRDNAQAIGTVNEAPQPDWDEFSRNLAEAIAKAQRSGQTELVAALNGLEREVREKDEPTIWKKLQTLGTAFMPNFLANVASWLLAGIVKGF